MNVAADSLDARQRYRLLTSTVVPRPIAWVSTLSAADRRNLAPFSYFGLVSATPPVLAFSGGRRGQAAKDTVENARATGAFVVNVVDEAHAERMNATSVDAPHGVDEFGYAGLEAAPSVAVPPPRVASAPVSFECELEHVYEVAPGGNTVLFGRIVHLHVRDDLLTEAGAVDERALAAVARLGGRKYARLGEIFELARPQWDEDP